MNQDNKLADLYDKLSTKTKEVFHTSSEKTLATLEKAIEASRENLVKAGELTQQESEHLKQYLRRDLEQFSTQVNKVKDQAKEKVEPAVSRAEAGFLDLTAHIAHSAADLFDRLEEWADSKATYRTGQVTSAGVLRCKECNKDMHFKKTGSIPPCPNCHCTEFRKVA